MSTLAATTTAPLQPGITTAQVATGGGGAVSNPHPDYLARRPDWVLMFDTNEGQRHVKAKKDIYLPPTSGMRALGLKKSADEGTLLYAAYLTRAFFPDLVKETVRALAGILDREPANIELPPALEDMREIATPKNESLNDLLVQIHMNQLLYGRLGLLVDVDPSRDLPVIIQYPAPQVINWDDLTMTADPKQTDDQKRREAVRRLLMVVLDETRFERDTGDPFTWNMVPRYRALTLGKTDAALYTSIVERDGSPQEPIVPSIRGKTLDEIPFVFVNTTDLATKPADVPLLNLANLSLAIYRGEADHRSALFMSGQDTLVLIGYDVGQSDEGNPGDGSDKPIIGSGAYLNLPNPDADAKFIGPNSKALAEQRTSLENDYVRAGEEGVKLLSSGAGAEAAETLRIRVAARTATLQTIAMTSASALETSLRQCAVWVGANPDDVKVEPNLDFIDERSEVGDLVKFAQAKKAGTPISWKSVHNWLRQKDFTEFTFDDELEQIAIEDEDDRLKGGEDPFRGMFEPGQPFPGQPIQGQPAPGQPAPGQPAPGQPGAEDGDGDDDGDE